MDGVSYHSDAGVSSLALKSASMWRPFSRPLSSQKRDSPSRSGGTTRSHNLGRATTRPCLETPGDTKAMAAGAEAAAAAAVAAVAAVAAAAAAVAAVAAVAAAAAETRLEVAATVETVVVEAEAAGVEVPLGAAEAAEAAAACIRHRRNMIESCTS